MGRISAPEADCGTCRKACWGTRPANACWGITGRQKNRCLSRSRCRTRSPGGWWWVAVWTPGGKTRPAWRKSNYGRAGSRLRNLPRPTGHNAHAMVPWYARRKPGRGWASAWCMWTAGERNARALRKPGPLSGARRFLMPWQKHTWPGSGFAARTFWRATVPWHPCAFPLPPIGLDSGKWRYRSTRPYAGTSGCLPACPQVQANPPRRCFRR